MVVITALAWTFFGVCISASAATFGAYLMLPLARRLVRVHVVLLAYSYTIFASAPTLHLLGVWRHNPAVSAGPEHFGEAGWCLLVSAAVTGLAGIFVALGSIAERLTIAEPPAENAQ